MVAMRSVKVVSFDVWNTLLRLDAVFDAVAERIARILGKDLEEVRKIIDGVYQEARRFRRLREASVDEVLDYSRRLMSERLGLGIDVVLATIREVFRTIEPSRVLFPDTLPCLEKLSSMGIDMGVVGNVLFWSSRETEELLDRVGIARFFKVQIYADRIGVSKPSRGIFLELCRALNVDPSNVIHVGDSVVEDVGGALSNGMRAVLIKRDLREPKIIPELGIAIVPSLTHVPQLIEKNLL